MEGIHNLERVALTREQVDAFNLIPQPVKGSDSRAADWPYDGSWELDAVPASELVGLVRNAIEKRLPEDFEARREADQDARAELYERWTE